MGKIAGILVLMCGIGGSIAILTAMPPSYTMEGLHARSWYMLAAATLFMLALGLGAICLELGRCADYLRQLIGGTPAPEAAPASKPAPVQASLIPCPKCGHQINEYATVCPKCKIKLNHGQSVDNPSIDKSGTKN